MALRIVKHGTVGSSVDHDVVINRDLPNQHPISAITDLESILDNIDTFMDNVNDTIGGNAIYPSIVDLEIEPRVYQEFVASAGQTVFTLQQEYTPGNHSLRVYKNGHLLNDVTDYIETNSDTITLTSPCILNDVIIVTSEGRTNINSPIHEEYVYSTSNIFSLAYRYNVGDNGLSVYRNGLRLNVNRDYIETDPYTVTITKTLTAGDILVFRRETHMAAEVELIDDDLLGSGAWREKHTIVAGNLNTISLTNRYIPESNTIQVFAEGLLMSKGATNDYVETNDSTITFNYNLTVGDIVDVVCVIGVFQWIEKFVSLAGQTTFRLKNKYIMGIDNIQVYEDGFLLTSGADYIEVNHNTILFVDAPEIGSKITVYRRR